MKIFHLQLLLATIVLLVTPSAALSADPEPLRLLCWTEYVPRPVIDGFTKKTGVPVTVENYNSNEQMLTILRTRPGYYDLVQPSQAYVTALTKVGGLAEIDRTRIPNWKNLDPEYLGLPHDPEGKYSVPWLSGTVGIAVDTSIVQETIADWKDVFSGKYQGRIVIVDDHREMAAWALASIGLPIADISDANLQQIAPILRRWLPQVAVFDSDSPHAALLNGKAVIGVVWSGEAALLWQKDRKYRYVLPASGAHMFLDSLAIPARAPHQSRAEEFINYCLEPEVSVQISNAYPYTNPNRAARALLTRDQLDNPASYPPGNPHLTPLRNVGNETKTVDEFVRRIRTEVLR